MRNSTSGKTPWRIDSRPRSRSSRRSWFADISPSPSASFTLSGMSDPQCLFCKIAGGEIPAKIIYQDDDVVSFEDINPQAPVHLLVISRTHIPSLDALDEAQESTVGRVVRLAAELARSRGLATDGYRLVINCGPGAGQTVYHLHVHLLGGRGFGWPPG